MTQLRLFTIPNLVTIANLASGFIGIQLVFSGNLEYACFCIYLASIFDFLDGFVARLFKSTSELWKQLDSLSDLVSFGVLPGFLIFALLQEYKWVSIIIPLLSALRLAKFNIDNRQKNGFIGVPTPINALLISSLVFMFNGQIFLQEINLLLITLVLFSSVMLLVELPLLDLKFNNFDLIENKMRYLFLGFSLVFIPLLKWECFIAIYFLYIFLSFVQNISIKVQK